MNELSQFLVESILLGEADSVDNKVVVYAGRFQPFHKGHYATYSHLVKKFGKNNVYIGTSNKTDNNKSPFNFKEKVMIITKMFGIPSSRIIEVKNPYVPTEVLKKFDKDTTAFITVVGKKDASRLGGKFFTPYKDNLDFEGYEDKGYVYIAPNQSNPISGTDVRNGLKSGSEDDKKNFFSKRAYPKFDKKIFGFITNTLNEERIITKEMVESWLIQNVDLIKEATSTMGKASVDDGPNYIFPSYAVFDRVSKKRAEAIGYTVLSQIMSDELTDIDPHPIYPNGPVKAVTPFPAGVAGKTTATNQKDYYGSEAYSKWWSHVTRLAGLVGYSLIDYIDLDDDREESLRDLRAEKEEVGNTVSENITIPINVGDTVLGGKFKNKRIVVKTIGKNEKGDITINGKSILRIRVIEEGTLVELAGTEIKCEKCNHQWEIESDDTGKYLCHNCGWDSHKQELDIAGLYKWKESNSMLEELSSEDRTLIYQLTSQALKQMPKSKKQKEVIKKLNKVRVKNGMSPLKEDTLTEIPMADLQKIDKYADKQLNPIDIVLTDKHFFDRLTDPRNKKEISQAELIGFFKRLGKKKKNFVNFLNLYGQIVAKDNRTNLNIPFMKQANKVIAKTIMRKDDFKSSDPEYKFESLPTKVTDKFKAVKSGKPSSEAEKDFNKHHTYSSYAKRGSMAEPDTIDFDDDGKTPGHQNKEKDTKKKGYEPVTEGLLTEGGAYGHMNHPFDTEINLTFGQLKDIVNKALEGNLDLAREKTDGQALAVSWRDGRLVAARNKGHLKNKGENALDINGVATKFAGRGELEKAYNFAMNDLSKAIKSLSEKQRDKIFKGGACFMNLEVIYPTSVNVIPYGQALLVFHGTMEFNEEGIAIGENQDAAKILAGMIKQVNQDVQSAYTISGPPINELPKSKNLTSLKGKYNSQISKLQKKFKLKDTDGIANYHQAFWMDFVNKKSPSKLDNRTLMGLVKRWAFYDKSFRLDKKNLSDVKTMEWAKGIDKNDHAKMAKDNIRPFEDIFLGIGADILSFMSSVLAANPKKAVRDMKKQLDKTIKDVRKSGDVKKIAKLKMELQRLKAIGGTDKIVPNEGIVFVYGGKTFKLTGTFAPLNQILGLFYE